MSAFGGKADIALKVALQFWINRTALNPLWLSRQISKQEDLTLQAPIQDQVEKLLSNRDRRLSPISPYQDRCAGDLAVEARRYNKTHSPRYGFLGYRLRSRISEKLLGTDF
jgi:hypothetical protein